MIQKITAATCGILISFCTPATSFAEDTAVSLRTVCQQQLIEYGGQVLKEEYTTRENGKITFHHPGGKKVGVDMQSDTSNVSLGILKTSPTELSFLVIVYFTHSDPFTKQPRCIIEPVRNYDKNHQEPLRFADGTISNDVH